MPGTERCDEILRLIDAVLDEPAVPVAAPAAPVAAVAPPASPPVRPAVEQQQRWLRRLHLRHHRDARYVAPPPPAPARLVRFDPSLHTAGDLTAPVRSQAPLFEAG